MCWVWELDKFLSSLADLGYHRGLDNIDKEGKGGSFTQLEPPPHNPLPTLKVKNQEVSNLKRLTAKYINLPSVTLVCQATEELYTFYFIKM